MAPVGCDCRGGCYGSRPLAGLNGSLSGPFVSPMNSRDNPGCRYHTEVIKIPRRDECTGQIAGDVSRLGEKKKNPKQQSVALACDNDLSMRRCGRGSTVKAVCWRRLLSPLSREDCPLLNPTLCRVNQVEGGGM